MTVAAASLSARGATLAYGALGLPLAFAALPIYVHVPRLYADALGLSLATVGLVLLAARIVDALTDPMIGWVSDRACALPAGRVSLIALALPVLGLGMIGLLAPPDGAGALWLALSVTVVSLAYSVATIAYNAWGAEVAPDPVSRTQVVVSREGFALAGVILAAGLPGLLVGNDSEADGLARMAWIFLPILLLFATWTLLLAPRAPKSSPGRGSVLRGLAEALGCLSFRRLLLVFAANGIAAAIPSATVLFFVADVLQAPQLAGLFLMIYFLSAACSLPLWARLSRHLGKLRTWCLGMVLAMAVFVWAGLLGAGEFAAFGVICLLSGMALGADLSMPPSLLADLLARESTRADGEARAGAWFGWWNFVTKANLALAAGLALPLLGWLGYAPGARSPDALLALAGVYALVPVLLKVIALALAWRWRALFDGATEGRLGAQ
ncbi:MFS transporter [Azoarcus communis]|uniref:MFS transporter n=1 Tax=Parazoarcus communis SWub3 = DSM 12120 TaxID=1121029 RepID=A0A323UTQ3_9RHOO|nr:MFS transporter [Parazoarcus communis]NMG50312.1 MFS transporter [Parazoarcus communis]NMG71348.1 MFS transporter [Parazoarcus communis SWub3 = DSM 12120]PZA15671.1 MFS transporter [Azoarcus communis] [Parazoarcus communis SWub3 = DSM 12120]